MNQFIQKWHLHLYSIHSFIYLVCWLIISLAPISAGSCMLSSISSFAVRILDGQLIFYKISRASENQNEWIQKLARSRSWVPSGNVFEPKVPTTPGTCHAFSYPVLRTQLSDVNANCIYFWGDGNANGAICLCKLNNWTLVTGKSHLVKTRNTRTASNAWNAATIFVHAVHVLLLLRLASSWSRCFCSLTQWPPLNSPKCIAGCQIWNEAGKSLIFPNVVP